MKLAKPKKSTALNKYSEPTHTKNCQVCGKEISTKWKKPLCQRCNDWAIVMGIIEGDL